VGWVVGVLVGGTVPLCCFQTEWLLREVCVGSLLEFPGSIGF
jgi:hypothetical protein